jgi:PAS domain S-box-containing protein
MAELFGYDEGELTGVVVEKLIPSVLAHRHEQYRHDYMKNPVRRPMGKNMTLHGRHKSGREFPIEISLSYYNTDKALFVIAFIIDISDRFDQQARIQRMNSELKSLNESLEMKVAERTLVLKEALHELEVSRDELSQALENEKGLNELKSRFISTASHEFRTPLSSILSSLFLIEKYTDPVERENEENYAEKRNKHIDKIKNSINHLTELLNDFLSLEKLTQGKIEVKKDEFDLKLFSEEIVEEIKHILKPDQTIIFSYTGENIIFQDKRILNMYLIY